MDGIRETVKGFILEHTASGQAEELSDHAGLSESGLMDSLTALKLVAFLENEYHIEVQTSDLEGGHLRSLASIVRFVTDRTAPR